MAHAQTSRLEAFSDGVLAVIITIMVLELRTPAGDSLQDLKVIAPHFLVYLLSFQLIGTYWNNHHHLLRATKRINARVMWSNLGLLFCLSLVPFFTSWLGEHDRAKVPTACFGAILFISAIAYTLLTRAILAANHDEPDLKNSLGNDSKGIISLLTYGAAIPLAFISPWISDAIFILIALMWFIPDKRLDKPELVR